jgi:hypothetical protein
MKKLFLVFFLCCLVFQVFLTSSYAQLQEVPFSANDSSCASYQCFNGEVPKYDSGKKLCMCGDELAYFKPPTLQQLEIWFVRLVYIVWAIVGSFSFLMLVYLGYMYMLKGGTSDQALVDLRRRIVNYVIGVILVFLAVPILTTFFRFLNIDGGVECYKFATSGEITFKFFFPELCTDPLNVIVSDPCNFQNGSADGFACPTNGKEYKCSIDDFEFRYKCINNIWEYESNIP